MIDKQLYRKIKRQVKRDGNRNRRRFLKEQLVKDPNNVHLMDDYYYKYDTSTHLNGMDKDQTRKKTTYL